MYDRRSFLKTGTLSVLGGYLFLGHGNSFGRSKQDVGYFAIPDSVLSDTTSTFTRETFLPHLNSSFTLVNRKMRALGSLRLAEIPDRNIEAGSFESDNIDGFNLIFANEGKLALADGVHRVSHPAIGEFSIFVSTVGRSGLRYQAVFARRRY